MSTSETLAKISLERSDLNYIRDLERLLIFTDNNDISRDEIEKRLAFMYAIINTKDKKQPQSK